MEAELEVFWYMHLSPAQEAVVTQFAAELQRRGVAVPDVLVLKRFLKARQFDVQKAVAMYLEMLEWRKAQKVDEVGSFTYEEKQQVLQCYPKFYHKTDKHGRPVYIELLGQCDVSQLLKVTTVERYLRFHIQCWEEFERRKLPACSEAAGKPIVSTTVILDLSGLSLKNFTAASRQLIIAIARLDQDNYPEHLGALFVINAPFAFRAIWAFVKPLLDEGTASKVQVLGTAFQKDLLALIPKQNLWVKFGGESQISEFTDVGPWVTDKSAAVATSPHVVASAGAASVAHA